MSNFADPLREAGMKLVREFGQYTQDGWIYFDARPTWTRGQRRMYRVRLSDGLAERVRRKDKRSMYQVWSIWDLGRPFNGGWTPVIPKCYVIDEGL